MRISRRDFLKAAAAAAASGKMAPAALAGLRDTLLESNGPRVIWLQGQGCDGCTVSLLNTIHYASFDELLLNTIELDFHNTVMASAGDLAVSAAEAASVVPGYVLVIEGAIPTGAEGRYCRLWPGMSMYDGVMSFAENAGFIMAVGACATFGGCTAAAPNPTNAKGVGEVLGSDPRLINVPGCPCHPDWIVGTVAYLLTNGHVPPLDEHRRPLQFFGKQIHHNCFKRGLVCGETVFATKLGEEGCMERLGCKGKHTHADCYVRKWNSSGPGEYGVNWCIESQSPCLGCVEPSYPDGMSPFFVELPPPVQES